MTQRSVNGPTVVEILRRHFEPALEMLCRAIRACPDEYWDARDDGTPFWQYAYHTLFWLDLWLSDSPEAFKPPSFHTGDALFESGEAPPPPLTREQLEGYAEQLYRKCATLFDRLTPTPSPTSPSSLRNGGRSEIASSHSFATSSTTWDT